MSTTTYKGRREIIAEITLLKRKYERLGLRGKELKEAVRKEMNGRYGKDGRILKIIQIVLMILFFFL